MLRTILLILAIVAGLAAAVVNFTVVKQKIEVLTTDRNDQRTAKEEFHHELDATNKVLLATQKDLANTKTQLADSESARTKLSSQLDQANTQISDLNGKLAKTTQQLNDTSGQLEAYKATGLTPPQVLALNKNLQNTQVALDVANQEKLVLTRRVTELKSQLAELTQQDYFVALPASLKGKVMAVDPKWDFIVLNIGENQGVLNHAEMLVSRDGKLVAKVVVRSVQKDRSIANIMPGWQLGDVIEGDLAIPAHPAS
jgi:phage-related tail protein